MAYRYAYLDFFEVFSCIVRYDICFYKYAICDFSDCFGIHALLATLTGTFYTHRILHDYIWYSWSILIRPFFCFLTWLLIASAGQSLRPRQIPRVVYILVPAYWGQTFSMCEDPAQGLDFVEPETWYNKKSALNNGFWVWDFVANAGLWFCRAPPSLFNFVSTKSQPPTLPP